MTPGRLRLSLLMAVSLAFFSADAVTVSPIQSRIIFPTHHAAGTLTNPIKVGARHSAGSNFAPITAEEPSISQSGSDSGVALTPESDVTTPKVSPVSTGNESILPVGKPLSGVPPRKTNGTQLFSDGRADVTRDADGGELTTATLQRSAPAPASLAPTLASAGESDEETTVVNVDSVQQAGPDSDMVGTEMMVTVVPMNRDIGEGDHVSKNVAYEVSASTEGVLGISNERDWQGSKVVKTEPETGAEEIFSNGESGQDPEQEPQPEPEPGERKPYQHVTPKPRGAHVYWPTRRVTTSSPHQRPRVRVLFPSQRPTISPTQRFPPPHWPTLPVHPAPPPFLSVHDVTKLPKGLPPNGNKSSKSTFTSELEPPQVYVPDIPRSLTPPHAAPEPEPEPESEPEPVGLGVPMWTDNDDLEPFAEPSPEWSHSRTIWGPAWPLHVFVGGGSFALLALLALIALIRVGSFKHLLSRTYFMTLTGLVMVLSALRALYLLLDPYNADGTLPLPVNYLLFNIPVPCMTSAFSILFLSLLNATQVQLLRPRIQTAGCLAAMVAFHFAFSVGTDLVVGFQFEGRFLLALCQMMFVFWGLALSTGYWYIFATLYRAALRRQADDMRDTITKLQIEGGLLPRRLPRPTLGIAVRLTVIVSVLALLLAGLQAYGMIWVYDSFGLFTSGHLTRPRPWSWWCYQTLARAVELVMASLLLYVASQPLRHHEPRQRRNCAVFSLCGSWARGARLRPKMADGMRSAEQDYYPTVCSRNQVVQSASQDGRLAFSDHLQLSAGHALPVALPQRRTVRRAGSAEHSATPGGSRPPSLLQPPLPELPHVETTYQPVLSAATGRNGFSTVRSSGTQTSEEYTDVCQPGGRTSRSLDTDEHTSSTQPTPSRALCRQASTCSSESAAHSFTVRLYHTAEACGGQARLRPRLAVEDVAAATCPRPARHRLSCPLPADETASDAADDGLGSTSSEGGTNFLTDVSTSGSLSQPNLTDSRGGLSDSRGDISECLSRSGSTPVLDSPRHHISFSLPLHRPAAVATDTTSDDVTPDSAVVVDYDGACQQQETSCDVTDGAHSDGGCSSGSGRIRHTAVRFIPAASAASLNELMRQYRSRSGSRRLLDRLRGSTFSLQLHKKGYSPLGSTGSIRRPVGGEDSVGLVDCSTQTDFPSCGTSRSDLASDTGDVIAECDVTDGVTSGLSRRLLHRHILGLSGRTGGLQLARFAGSEETGV